MTAHLKQPKKNGRSMVIHAPANQKMIATLCFVSVGRSWTITTAAVNCPACIRAQKERMIT
jgi:hypothetical protein